jgi:hypothetical protein
MPRIVIALAALLAAGIAAAQAPTASPAPFADAFKTFQQAQGGDSSRIEAAIAAFDTLARSEPQQPLYTAYLGSALGLRAREARMPLDRLKHSEQGLDHVDRALAALKPEHDKLLVRGVPVGLETRLVAANLFIGLPDEIFHRRTSGRKLIEEIVKHPAYGVAPDGFRQAVQRAVDAAEAAK